MANSIKESSEKAKLMGAELEKLALWGKLGKTRRSDIDAKRFLSISLLDDSIGPELRSMKLVLIKEFDEFFDDETCYPELFADAQMESQEDEQ